MFSIVKLIYLILTFDNWSTKFVCFWAYKHFASLRVVCLPILDMLSRITPLPTKIDQTIDTLIVKATEFLNRSHTDISKMKSVLWKGWDKNKSLECWFWRTCCFELQAKLFAFSSVGDTSCKPKPVVGPVLMEWDGEHNVISVAKECEGQRRLVDLNLHASIEYINNDKLFEFTQETEAQDTELQTVFYWPLHNYSILKLLIERAEALGILMRVSWKTHSEPIWLLFGFYLPILSLWAGCCIQLYFI